jgi:hypothetical protein
MAVLSMCVAIVSSSLVVTSAGAQQLPIDLVGGAATAETSAEHSTLATFRIEAGTPRFDLGDGWSIRGIGHAGWQPLFTMRDTSPVYRQGISVAGGLRIAHTTARIETALAGRAGTTHVSDATNGSDWAAFFEGGVDFRWIVPFVDVYAGIRHDERLRRIGALSSYRDPTGRVLLSVSVFPLRRGPFTAGVAIESETALPGEGRLPSGLTIGALFRLEVPRP